VTSDEGLDGRVSAVAETRHEASVGMGIHARDRSRLLPNGTRASTVVSAASSAQAGWGVACSTTTLRLRGANPVIIPIPRNIGWKCRQLQKIFSVTTRFRVMVNNKSFIIHRLRNGFTQHFLYVTFAFRAG
jgi:hypothetical protein